MYYLGFEGGNSTAAPCLNTYPASVAPFLDLQCHPSQVLLSRTAKLITQVQCRLLLGNGASTELVPRRPAWGLRTHLPGRPALFLDRDGAFPAAVSSMRPLSHSAGSNKETTVSSRRRSGRMEGPIPWISSSSHTFWCQTHFISSRLGTQGLPLQDYFLLQFVFQLETLGAPQQEVMGGGGQQLLCFGP